MWVVLPVKPLNRAKSRLAGVLSADQRQRFAEMTLRHILETTRSARSITGTLVISRDNKVLSIARDFGARTVQESGQPALNPALMRATQMLASWNAGSILVLPADVPLITANDITDMIRLAGTHEQCVVIATDRSHDGTNALLVRPPGLIEYDYGPQSYQRHLAQARALGVHVAEYDSLNLQYDLDVPEDINAFYQVVFGHAVPDGVTLAEAFDQLQFAFERRMMG
ncbi:MAG: 2-phospho-L-lactate guanylyltransferase [Anaerolineae bacterium]|jgi:2-phospho-L-lactate guanylyltransferase|nr:MAG: 2-phospho-L-lactate guanylyltransferase CofC [Chloroflexi bacterium OLB13]MBC6955363.1 2-phospho-L-lactate guanylyltransferase [Chloroflexota bacterium]MBV6435598.1 2-phospho-L-lactate guanylyltransferase [Anaerolineae bacterium]MDL1915677.1 2-phospho-L-lactate guanylyltransferase [Anaerolineae bacterium CFX4]OQY86598.1 MAG: 2-phospho-L-lactate guanylyltransferase [Anaerolineae bacterium UTCFX5]